MIINLHRLASKEARQAIARYFRIRENLGIHLRQKLLDALDAIQRRPQQFPLTQHTIIGRETRERVVARFPYAVVYELRVDEVFVLAVAHHNRSPGYWSRRNRANS